MPVSDNVDRSQSSQRRPPRPAPPLPLAFANPGPPQQPIPLAPAHPALANPQHSMQAPGPINPRKRGVNQASPATAKRDIDPSMTSSTMGESLPSMEPPGSPSSKRQRTNTPWTAVEEQLLKDLRDKGMSWGAIAESFPTRTEGSVKKHFYKDMHYATFGDDEAEALKEAIKEYETNKWKVIGQKLGKPAKACENYAREHFQSEL
ncbi:putative myb dna-binding domain protein [Phaeomoniella chlamydospora]|uniref:Putative myb dna-binding domain protein n=1 Tax=Phaeomoniella chlamydospora TaxID=158046 RepID=A0A0G2E5V0_PHACM|nr:putative myb dna-binding domain protein [Phaeomoniella chlamydospora]